MRYFVKEEFIEPGVLYPQDKFIQMVEDIIIPSFNIITKMEEENKILSLEFFQEEELEYL